MTNAKENPLKDSIEKIFEELVPEIVNTGKKTLGDIKKDAQEAWVEFLKNIQENKMPKYIVAEEVEFLNSKKLIELAKKYIVAGSNEVYVMKRQEKDAVKVFLAYGKDKTPLQKEQNKYVIIKAEGLSADILGMFEQSEVVILK